jgi:hypothetical protein
LVSTLGKLSALVAFSTFIGFACSSTSYTRTRETGPTLVIPTNLGEGSEQDAGAPRPVQDAAPVAKPLRGSLPDPEPLRTAEQWEYEFVYDAGEVRVGKVQARTFPQPVVTSRKMGRFAVELWIGRELIERVRFDFPLIAADEPSTAKREPLRAAPTMGAKAHAVQRVLVPASARAVRAVLVDRATEREQPLPWPPDRPLDAEPIADAGVHNSQNQPDAQTVQAPRP